MEEQLLDQGATPSSSTVVRSEPRPTPQRPILENVVLVTNAEGGWIRVSLRWPDGELSSGVSTAGERRMTRAQAAATATIKALTPALARSGAKIEVEDVLLHEMAGRDAVLIHAVHLGRTKTTPIVGSAYIYDDVASASVKALLKATNRVLV